MGLELRAGWYPLWFIRTPGQLLSLILVGSHHGDPLISVPEKSEVAFKPVWQ